LIYGFIIEGPAAPLTGVAVTLKGRGATTSTGDPADNTVNLSIVESEADGSSPFTLLSHTSIGTEPYLYTLFLYPGVQYQIDMEASVYTNGLNGMISATLDPNVFTDTQGYSILFGDGIGNGTGVTTAPEPSTWAMLLLGFAGLGLAGSPGKSRVSSDGPCRRREGRQGFISATAKP
jgi:PEP-CTERM motif